MTDQPTATTDAEEDLRGTTRGATLPEAQRDLVVALGTLTDLHARWKAEINKWEEEVRQWERRWNDPLLLLRRAYALLNERDVVHDASRSAGETLPVVSRDATRLSGALMSGAVKKSWFRSRGGSVVFVDRST